MIHRATGTASFHRLRRHRRASGSFTLAPLVDVVLLLLIFLLLSARFDRSQVVEVELPRVPPQERGLPSSAEQRVVTLGPDGSLAWNGRPIERAELGRILSAAPEEDRLLPLVIRGDARAALGAGLGLLEFLRGLGYPHCVFQVEGVAPANDDGTPPATRGD